MKLPETPEEVVHSIYLIGGEESSISDKWVNAIRSQVFRDGGEDFNFDRFDARELNDVDAISRAARTLPMLSPKRLVLVKHAEVLLTLSKDRAKPLLDYAENPDPCTVLIFYVNGKISKASALAKALRKAAHVVESNALREREVLPWLKNEMSAKGVTVQHDAALLLVECLGNDLRSLMDAVGRLTLFVGEGAPITAQAVSELVVPSRTKNIWEFLDALGDRAPGKALQTVAQLLDQGDAPLQILAMVSRFYRQLTIGHTVLHRGGSKSEAAKRLAYPTLRKQPFRDNVAGIPTRI